MRIYFDNSKGIVSDNSGNGVDLQSFGVQKTNSTTIDPTASNDSSSGYSVGSRWWNTSTDEEFVCLDASAGLAVWTSTTTSSGGGGSTGPAGNTVWVADASVSSSVYPISNIRYVPLRNGNTDSLEYQFVSAISGSITTQILFSMSASEANSVTLHFDQLVFGIGGDPNAAPTLGTPVNITPGADVLLHSASLESSNFTISANAGDIIYCKLTRSGSSDSHTGDMRVIEVRVS